MRTNLDILKGIHPGKIIDRELKKRNASQRSFAASIGEHSQSLNAVITRRRHLTTELAVKLEQALGYDEGFLLALQAYYDVAEYKRKAASESVSGEPNIRKILFWDTDFKQLDWGRYKTAVIQRVLERGSEEEKQEIARFYGTTRAELDKFTFADSCKSFKNTINIMRTTIKMGNDEFILYIRKQHPNNKITTKSLGNKIWEWISKHDSSAIKVKEDQPCEWEHKTGARNIDELELPKTATQFEFNRELLPKLYDFLDCLGRS